MQLKQSLVIASVICLSSISASAQGGGGGQQLDPAARAAMMKDRYKALGCNDVQVDSVIAITNDFRPKMMALRDLDQDARAEKMKEINRIKHFSDRKQRYLLHCCSHHIIFK